MVIQLNFVFVLTLTFHLRHLLQSIEHGVHNPFERSIDIASDLKHVDTDQLVLNSCHIALQNRERQYRGLSDDTYREGFDEGRYTFTLLHRQFGLLDGSDLLVL